MSKQREALQLALDTLRGWIGIDEWIWPVTAKETCKKNSLEAIAAIREALAEPEQKPVAWMMVNEEHGHKPTLHWKPQEDWHITWKAVPLYAALPARKPLTEPELHAIEPTWPATWNYDDVLAFARAIERAHGIGDD